MDDLVARSDEFDKRLLAIPADRVFTKRTVVIGFIVLLIVFALGVTLVFRRIDRVTVSTNEAVTHEIPGLQKQIADRDEQLADAQAVIDQAVAAILQMGQMLRDAGIEPPEVILRPPDDPAPDQ